MQVQMWNGVITLLANWSSDIQVSPSAKIPPWLPNSSSLLSWTTPSKGILPSPTETAYAAWLFHHIDRSLFPEAKEFQEKSAAAMGVKDKYSLLKDIKAERFYDLIGEVIRVYERDGRVTLYLSDYTAHPLFYNNVWGGGEGDSSARDGDEYGYMKSQKKASNDWPGPYGKLSLQITVYDSHATFVREKVKNGDWVILRNVQVKMGNLGGCIEGFLRGDRYSFDSKVQVQIIRRAEDAERNDVRWKDGLRRKLEWWDKFKKQKQRFLEEAQDSQGRRKLDDAEGSKPNSKKRRKEMRAAGEQKAAEIEKRTIERLDLNSNGTYLPRSYYSNNACY
jgi:protection of telomeres protein 1